MIENYFEYVNFAITISDKDGNIIYMNDKSKATFQKDKPLIGANLKDCHQLKSWEKIQSLLTHKETNVYTIEKNGVKKLIYQTPWYNSKNEVAGLIELSLIIPFELPHFVRS